MRKPQNISNKIVKTFEGTLSNTTPIVFDPISLIDIYRPALKGLNGNTTNQSLLKEDLRQQEVQFWFEIKDNTGNNSTFEFLLEGIGGQHPDITTTSKTKIVSDQEARTQIPALWNSVPNPFTNPKYKISPNKLIMHNYTENPIDNTTFHMLDDKKSAYDALSEALSHSSASTLKTAVPLFLAIGKGISRDYYDGNPIEREDAQQIRLSVRAVGGTTQNIKFVITMCSTKLEN